MNHAAVNVDAQLSVPVPAFHSLGRVLRSGSTRLYGNSMFNLLSNRHTVFHSWLHHVTLSTTMHKVPICLYPCNTCYVLGFFVCFCFASAFYFVLIVASLQMWPAMVLKTQSQSPTMAYGHPAPNSTGSPASSSAAYPTSNPSLLALLWDTSDRVSLLPWPFPLPGCSVPRCLCGSGFQLLPR